jgi:hypothetical protein
MGFTSYVAGKEILRNMMWICDLFQESEYYGKMGNKKCASDGSCHVSSFKSIDTHDFDFFSSEEAEVFNNTVGIYNVILLLTVCVLRTCVKLLLRSCLKNWDGREVV